jgi:uncharacterized glyoxalase superfamily protein PhnB
MSTPVGIWPTYDFRDVDAMIGWLKAIGFEEKGIYRDTDPSVVVHAEMMWPNGGGIMFGSHRDNPDWPTQPGGGSTYLVTKGVDKVYAAAIEAGATGIREPRDEEYGGRGATVRDPEGNLWSFGSYRPEET